MDRDNGEPDSLSTNWLFLGRLPRFSTEDSEKKSRNRVQGPIAPAHRRKEKYMHEVCQVDDFPVLRLPPASASGGTGVSNAAGECAERAVTS